MRTITIACQKGGSAKSTTAVQLAAGLARSGRRVLVADMDPQGHVGIALGLDPRTYRAEMTEVLERKVTIDRAIITEVRENLSVLPSTPRLSQLELMLVNEMRREDRLKSALAQVSTRFDYTICDTPPSLGLLTINALSAADEVLIPMTSDYFGFLGVQLLCETLEKVRTAINPQLRALGILATRVTRTHNARELIDQARALASEFGEHYPPLIEISIPETVRFREAATEGKTIFEIAPESPGALAYAELTRYVESHA